MIYPPRNKQGFTVFFTGLSGSGKTTVADVLWGKLLKIGGRLITSLDSDIVRRTFSSGLGYSKEHRNINVLRVGLVALGITMNGGVAICSLIAPYDVARKQNRELISRGGGYILVYVSTSLEECERRDIKGLYAKARAGVIKDFTGIDDPYEIPSDADIVIDTVGMTPQECVQQIITYLEKEGFLV